MTDAAEPVEVIEMMPRTTAGRADRPVHRNDVHGRVVRSCRARSHPDMSGSDKSTIVSCDCDSAASCRQVLPSRASSMFKPIGRKRFLSRSRCYLFPQLIGIGKIQLLAKYSEKKTDAGVANDTAIAADKLKTLEINANYLIKPYNARGLVLLASER